MNINKPKREPGLFKGKIWIADDFDAPLPVDILDDFEGKYKIHKDLFAQDKKYYRKD